MKFYWSIIRTVTFYIVGLMNTLFLRAEDVGGWKNYIGWLLLAIAVVDSVVIYFQWKKKKNAELAKSP